MPDIKVIDAAQVTASLPYTRLIPALREAFATGAHVPPRHHHTITAPGEPDATLLLMPAWRTGGYLGVKIIGVFPGNSARGLRGLAGSYLLSDATTGAQLALLDGITITNRRTAAVAALGADLLARPDASRLLIIGSGQIAAELPAAMGAIRPIGQVAVWNLRPASGAALVARFQAAGINATLAPDLETAVRAADIISCATLATEALVQGAWLSPGAHLDLIGAFTPAMREADPEAFRRATVFFDDKEALHQAGDARDAVGAGALDPATCISLATLCRHEHPGRTCPDSITLFKAVGNGLGDLAAATLAYDDLS